MESLEDTAELYRRFPEIDKIQNTDLRKKVEKVFLEHAPEYFWKVPASSSGKYHPKDHTGEHGLWLHTKRAFTSYERLARSYENSNRVSKFEINAGKTAILLHDLFKFGLPKNKKQHTVSNHDRIAYNYLKSNTNLPEEVLGCVDSHNGPWGEGKNPETDLEHLHHNADMIASDRNSYFVVYKPTKELQKIIKKPKIQRV